MLSSLKNIAAASAFFLLAGLPQPTADATRPPPRTPMLVFTLEVEDGNSVEIAIPSVCVNRLFSNILHAVFPTKIEDDELTLEGIYDQFVTCYLEHTPLG